MNPARSYREMASLHGVAGSWGLDARSNVCGVCGGAFALMTANTGSWKTACESGVHC